MKKVTRRQVLKAAAAFGAASALGCGPSGLLAASSEEQSITPARPRVAIVGGGAGGIALAYLLEGSCEVDLFEARAKIGGHCDSEIVDYQGQHIAVDLGAQFFHPDTHPIYTTLLEEVGLYDPAHPDADQTIEATGSVCLFPSGGGLPSFSSTQVWLTPIAATEFAVYSQYARQAILQGMSWEVRLDDWIASLPLSQGFKNDVLFPWISALIGTTHANAARSSARSILQTFALAFPANLLKGATTFNSSVGLQGNLQRMLDRSPGTRLHLSAPVQGLSLAGGTWSVQTPAGVAGPFDFVVLNAPPRVSKGLLGAFPWASDIVGLLDRYEYFDARMVIHTDATYMHRFRYLWAVYNAATSGPECEGSVWYGGIHQKLASGATVDLFKSWDERRAVQPAHILFERSFKHPLITADVIRATRSLHTTQGRNGLYFSGQHTTGFDLQEAATYSAIKVAEALAPASAPLASLRARLQLRGRTGISYDL